MNAQPTFTEAVHRVVAAIPPGEVLTYGEIAAEAGYPGAAQAVGTIVARSNHTLPCWRVVRAGGLLKANAAEDQARRLRDEGVTITEDGRRVVLPTSP